MKNEIELRKLNSCFPLCCGAKDWSQSLKDATEFNSNTPLLRAVVVHICNPSPQDTDARGPWVWRQPRLQGKTFRCMGAGDRAQLVECLSNTPGLIQSTTQNRTTPHTCNSNTWELKSGSSRVRDHCWLRNKLEARLSYMRLVLKRKKILTRSVRLSHSLRGTTSVPPHWGPSSQHVDLWGTNYI